VDDANAHYTEQLVRMTHINVVPLAASQHSLIARQESLDRIRNNGATEEQNVPLKNVHLPVAMGVTDDSLAHIGIPSGTRLCLVLGRLFKIHPEFDEIIVSVLLQLASSSDQFGAENVSPAVGDSTLIAFIAEDIASMNYKIIDRLVKIMSKRFHDDSVAAVDKVGSSVELVGAKIKAHTNKTVEDADTVPDAMVLRSHELIGKYVRFVEYEHYYDLLLQARVVFDTYPYGGTLV
jgi:hypothetical protein